MSTITLMYISITIIIALLAAVSFALFYTVCRRFKVRNTLHFAGIFVVIMLLQWAARALAIATMHAHTVILYIHFALIGVPAGWAAFMIWYWVKGKKKDGTAGNTPS